MTTAVREKPILFNSEMVRAILAGRKTQTRRVIKPQPPAVGKISAGWYSPTVIRGGMEEPGDEAYGFGDDEHCWKCPYGAPGDRLWVRETWRCVSWPGDGDDFREVIQYAADETSREIGHQGDHTLEFENWCERIAWDGAKQFESAGFTFDSSGRIENEEEYDAKNPPLRYKPSIHMPHWASRINLEVVSVNVERVQNISEEDAIAEGVYRRGGARPSVPEYSHDGKYWMTTARAAFACLWDSINAKRGYPWESNPWVWCVEFKRDLHAQRSQ